MSEQQNKTEKPTAWRLEKAKEKGDVPRSREIILAFSLLLTLFFFAATLPGLGRALTGVMQNHFTHCGEIEITLPSLQIIFKDSFFWYLRWMMPFFLMLVTSTILFTGLQGGIHFLPANLKLKFKWLQILKGIKRIMASIDTLLELVKSIIKIFVIGWIA